MTGLDKVSVARNKCFRRIFSCCWRECVWSHCSTFCSTLPFSMACFIHQRKLLFGKTIYCSDNAVLRSLSRFVYNAFMAIGRFMMWGRLKTPSKPPTMSSCCDNVASTLSLVWTGLYVSIQSNPMWTTGVGVPVCPYLQQYHNTNLEYLRFQLIIRNKIYIQHLD